MSKLFDVNGKDFLRGLIVSVTSASLTLILELLKKQEAIDWANIGTVALIAGIGYVLKNLLTCEEGKLVGAIKIK